MDFKNKPMKKVIRLDEPKEESKNPIELTHAQSKKGWVEVDGFKDIKIKKIVYLGRCDEDKDMFAVYVNNLITIAKGHLNDGVY